MKKHILLTTTAMLLSAITLNANAEPSNNIEIPVRATFIAPFEVELEKYLGFGIILADEGGKTVVVDTTGALDEGQTSATMMSTASFHSYEDYGGGNVSYSEGSLNEGVIRVKNALEYSNILGISDMYVINVNDDASLELTDDEGSLCGYVDEWTTEVEAEGDDMLIHVGGTLTTEDLRGKNSVFSCSGYATVTLILNEDNVKDLLSIN